MKTPFAAAILPLFLTALFFYGCAGITVITGRPVPTREELTRQYTARAETAQQQNDLRAALLYWKLVQHLNPEDTAVAGNIDTLKKTICKTAQAHFDRGLKFYQKGRPEDARAEFLKTLYLNPDHVQALDYITNKLQDKSDSTYRVKKGDRLRDIAEKFYNDPNQDVLIAYINGIKLNAIPKPGTVLVLPMMAYSRAETKLLSIENRVADAKQLYESKNYQKAIETAKEILTSNPGHTEALSIKNASLLELAKLSFQQGDPVKALQILKQADADAEGIQGEIKRIRTEAGRQAETYYQQGVALYLKEDLSGAIKQWEYALALNPDYEEAKKSIRNVKRLIKNMEQNTDTGKQPRNTLSEETGDRKKEKATETSSRKTDVSTQIENHYRKGINYFINENIEGAVKEWEIVLTLDPDHKDAKKYIEKARQLQRRIETME